MLGSTCVSLMCLMCLCLGGRGPVCVQIAAWCGSGSPPVHPPTPWRGWVDVMDVTWNLRNLRQAMCEQPADSRGWWMHFIWCAGVSKFWWRLADGCRVWVLLQHYWLQGDRYAKESHLILRQAAVKHTPPHTSSSECACLPNTPPPFPEPL